MDRIVWPCGGCGGPADHSDGYLTVNEAELQSYRKREKKKTPPGVLRPVIFTGILNSPSAPKWFATHSACDPHPDGYLHWPLNEATNTADCFKMLAEMMSNGLYADDTDLPSLAREIAVLLRQ